MDRVAKRVLIIVALIASFALFWAAMTFQWPAIQWMLLAVYGIFVLALIYALIRRASRGRRPSAFSPTASDEYSDIYLGRRAPTLPPRDSAAASQVGDPPHGDRPLPPRQ